MRKGGQSAARAQIINKENRDNKTIKYPRKKTRRHAHPTRKGFAGAQKENKNTEMNNDNKNGSTKTAVSAPRREELQNQSRRKTETIYMRGAEKIKTCANKRIEQTKKTAAHSSRVL